METVNKIGIPIGHHFEIGFEKGFKSVQDILKTSNHVKSNIISVMHYVASGKYNKEIIEPLLSSPIVIVEPELIHNINWENGEIYKFISEFKTIDSLKLPFPKMTFFVGEKHSKKIAGNVDTIIPYFISESNEGIIVTIFGVSEIGRVPGLFKLLIRLDKEQGLFCTELEKPSFSMDKGVILHAFTTALLTVHRMTLSEGDFYISIPSSRSTTKNKKRLAKGKAPLIEFKIAKITGKKTHTDPSSPHGTHASPCLHWRRGHWRTMSKSGKKTWIAPMEVGDEANGRIIKTYAIGKYSLLETE